MQTRTIPLETAFSLLECEKAFSALDQKQALYAYNFARASWNGAKICFFQRSYESPALLYIVLRAFETGAKHVFETLKNQFSQKQLNQIFIYVSAFLDNCGNFKSFGDSKFVPECSEETFKNFFLATNYWSTRQHRFHQIYNQIKKFIFSYQKPYELLNFSDKEGTTGYYSANISTADAEKVKQILTAKGILSQNNRLVKVAENKFLLKIASEQASEERTIVEGDVTIIVRTGQFAPFLRQANKYLTEAEKYSANEHQSNMMKAYITHFKHGQMEQHKESQRHWIKDTQPVIETNIGFIESYLDPLRVRAEWEGFVAVVNLEESQLLTKLVESAQTSLKYLPWGEQFEVQVFKKPDFTSLEVLAFASSGIPVGINIPNYDDIRQNLGFKNVNLGNVYGQPTPQSIQYTPQADIPNHLKYHNPSLFVLVALHELLGHGSGRLYTQKPTFPSPLDGSELTTYYKQNQTWHSVFGQIASMYEECKADSVALYLALFEDVQEILLPKYTKEERWEIVVIAWHDMIVGGLRGLQHYDVASKKWLQAHIGASFAIFRVLEEAGGIFEVKQTQRNGKDYLQVHINKDSILTKGKQAMGTFLKHLQIYKSTANCAQGTAYFEKYLQVDQKLLKYREVIMANIRPRRLTVQPDVKIQNGKVSYVKFQASSFGCIDSAYSHFSENVEEIIEEWNRNNQEFVY